MIYFKVLRWRNLLSTGNIDTEIQLNKSINTLIVGENGAGKSTILDALTYVLFGKAFRKVNKGQLINSITRKNLVVEIEFDIGSINSKIIRGQKPNIFEVYQNGTMINQSAEMRDVAQSRSAVKTDLGIFSDKLYIFLKSVSWNVWAHIESEIKHAESTCRHKGRKAAL